MDFTYIIPVGLALAMDAFAVSIGKGLCLNKLMLKHQIITGLYFGAFQAIMPVIGYFIGYMFKDLISAVDHWISFILLALIGINMIREALSKTETCDTLSNSFSAKAMLPLAVATSIDALTAGITFVFLEINIAYAAFVIGIITFILSYTGVFIGYKFSGKFKSASEFAGGVILIVMGIKILYEHMGFLT